MHNLYTLKTLKSHIKTLNICSYMFRSLMKPSSGGSYTFHNIVLIRKVHLTHTQTAFKA